MSNPERSPLVLIVDDEPLLRLVATDLLENEGYRVVDAANAQAALAVMAGRTDVSLLFTDIQMPGGMDGMELAAEVHRRWPDVQLVVTSGRLRPRDEDIPDHGRFLPKPWDSRKLLRQVEDLVGRTA